MSIEFLYKTTSGRALLKLVQKAGGYKLVNKFLQSGLSRFMIEGYISKNKIDMQEFPACTYNSFAEFFSRKKERILFDGDSNALISPCDGMLTTYPISEDLIIGMKGSHYLLSDIIPDTNTANSFINGLCLVFRLQASDYHHFCAIDDMNMGETHFIPGLLHSVQPIACENVPVYRLNKRWWRLLDTDHVGTVAQIEVGAMMVGDIALAKETGILSRGEEMGCFRLAGSTIILLLTEEFRNRLEIKPIFLEAYTGHSEIPIHMGECIGTIK